MTAGIWAALCLAAAGLGWGLAAYRRTRELSRRLAAAERALEDRRAPADPEDDRRAREAIVRFNRGIASILGFDADGGEEAGL